MKLVLLYATVLSLLAPQEDSLRIGLLVPDPHSGQVIEAAQKAIDRANRSGTYGEVPFKLITRTTEGFWGAGSKESVSLVYEDQALVILGSLDGRNAHLAEQVAAKSHLVYLETRSSDPTLSQAYVPWFFRIVPNDDQQARAILDRIRSSGGGSLAILSGENYDSDYAVKSFTKLIQKENGRPPLILEADSAGLFSSGLLQKLKIAQTDHLVIPYYSTDAMELLVRIRKEIPSMRIYGTLAFGAGWKESDSKREELQGTLLVHSYASAQQLHPEADVYAMYAYDGVRLILKAIQEVGPERTGIHEHLLSMTFADGLSGPIQFDAMGNRIGSIRFVQVEKGQWIPAE